MSTCRLDRQPRLCVLPRSGIAVLTPGDLCPGWVWRGHSYIMCLPSFRRDRFSGTGQVGLLSGLSLMHCVPSCWCAEEGVEIRTRARGDRQITPPITVLLGTIMLSVLTSLRWIVRFGIHAMHPGFTYQYSRSPLLHLRHPASTERGTLQLGRFIDSKERGLSSISSNYST
ncbi:hypothetical protein BJV74DRAFT_391877 [Russula compacta]|nr:hypothetical protein BJV74DRAFT_391877 [Russula compacta]